MGGGRDRGRVGSYYALADVGVALVLSIAPEGMVAEWVDAHGDTLARTEHHIARAASPDQVTAALRAAVVDAQQVRRATPRLAVVSAADPVDRGTGRLIQLPDAPFLLGELDPADMLAPYVDGPVTVDNDVNWAAMAERDCAPPGALRDFAYLYLDAGMGCAIVSDGEVRRGSGGLAGEVAHLVTTGPRGQAMQLIDVFGELGLRRPGSTAIDADRLLAAVSGEQAQAESVRYTLGQAISGVLAAVVALADPEIIIIGGSWGGHPLILDVITAASARMPRHAAVRAARLTAEPSLSGARTAALSLLRSAVVADAQRTGAELLACRTPPKNAARDHGRHGGRRASALRQNLTQDLPETLTAELRALCESPKLNVRRITDEGVREFSVMKSRVSLKSPGWL
jgi:predicted NBD/HSP70 family sugar kinase